MLRCCNGSPVRLASSLAAALLEGEKVSGPYIGGSDNECVCHISLLLVLAQQRLRYQVRALLEGRRSIDADEVGARVVVAGDAAGEGPGLVEIVLAKPQERVVPTHLPSFVDLKLEAD